MKNRNDCVSERLHTISALCRDLAEAKIRRCTFSFATMYDTVERRLKKNGFHIHPAPFDIQREMLGRMVETAAEYGIQLFTCVQPLVEGVPGVQKGHCVDGELLAALFGDKASFAKDKGQREACGCTASKDIGGYDQPCSHKCLYCYARPEE